MSPIEPREWLDYAPETGIFTWKKSPTSWVKPGDVAGHISKSGYIQIRLRGVLLYAHRLAFLFQQGNLPEHTVDHINGITGDNRWINLRKATSQENQRNTAISKNNKSGVTGVFWEKRREKWVAKIEVDYTPKFLGYFDNFDDAVTARKQAEKQYNFHPNHGRKSA